MGMMRSILLVLIVAVAVAEVTSNRRLSPSITLCPGEPFDVDADVGILKTAIDSSNVTAIIDVLTKRSRPQRVEIAKEYNTTYGVNLIENFESKLTGNVKNLIVVLMTPLFDSLAKELHDAISRSPIDEGAIIEMLCIPPESDITTAYDKKYGSLESDLKGKGSQPSLRRLLASRIATRLSREHITDLELLTSDAQRLDNAMKCINDPYLEYFADRLNASMAKDDTDERTLTRIIVTRSEFDLNHVKKTFNKRFGESLEKRIDERISDNDYKYALLSIITPSRRDCSTDADK